MEARHYAPLHDTARIQLVQQYVRVGNVGLLREARKYHACSTFKTALGANAAGFTLLEGLGYDSQLTKN